MEKLKKKRKVTPEKAMKLLAANGTQVSLEQARLIVDLMYKFAEIAIKPYIKSP
ncbi:MAG: hypothetical protein P0Y49_04470 [Candidatus Pedobacter colombiensis]|uniref:Uncharacterized protein n=1 Tax=Candidatus Pedobacter colombiensis TaxID=3121371 RepID=A0AAJ5W9E1_9SPHI|nr:hypothetical protein [Pedobacter sp.]WEK20391.1 MAG: hypothetical protein P0Y49_04470 [Pedobacter sp.]